MFSNQDIRLIIDNYSICEIMINTILLRID